jgi:hypothetical protein
LKENGIDDDDGDVSVDDEWGDDMSFDHPFGSPDGVSPSFSSRSILQVVFQCFWGLLSWIALSSTRGESI